VSAGLIGSIALLVFVPMLLEARRAARNELGQRARGGIEPDNDVYEVMRVAYPAAFLVMIVEGSLTAPPDPVRTAAGLTSFALAKVLKWWAILALGPAWTFRVVVVPHSTPVTSGPYRYLNHPNYVAVVAELVGIAMATRARLTGPLAVIGFGLLIWRRIQVEEKARGAKAPR
jgi:methyltransferase